MTNHLSDLNSVLSQWSDAIRQKDIEGLMAVYAPDIVYFDCVPPLRIEGLDGVRRNFLRWFETWHGPIGVEIRDRVIRESGDLGTAHMLHRTFGVLAVGREVDYWLRVSVVCQRSDNVWRFVNEHVSAPVDFAKGVAVLDLKP